MLKVSLDQTQVMIPTRAHSFGRIAIAFFVLLANAACTKGGLLDNPTSSESGADAAGETQDSSGLTGSDQEDIEIYRVSPTEGIVTGGTRITVYGKGFRTNNTTVRIGGKPCRQIVYIGARELSCMTPSGDVGIVDIEVFNVPLNRSSDADLSDRLAEAFTYFLPGGGSLAPLIGSSAASGIVTGVGYQLRGTFGETLTGAPRTGTGLLLKVGTQEANSSVNGD